MVHCEVIRFEEWSDKGSVTPAIVKKGINNWLEQHRPARLLHVAQSEGAVFIPDGPTERGTVSRSLTITIWYEDGA
ncbi:hypothetical protein SVA_2526 [Sulfurifustis variabilis]|uniref:Uncharacterized protein n=1 Tax=Sulfurifustis variabilis TaxID=1675686 RepID=A0A1B4VAY6_9GAMM|nr:hypothetical protein [Sulfurifustis variabilis]BAU49074.1 hypothetical protein SVA_2526 [Sulfurifustis variabilis]